MLFGAARLSGLGKSLGRGIREFRQELKDDDDDKKKTDAVASAPTEEKSSKTH